MGMKRREHFSAWENSPGDFIILIISAEVWNTENNKNGKIQKVRLIELYYPSEMRSWMFLKLKTSSIKDIFPLFYLIFPVVIAREARVEAESLSHSFNLISLSHQALKWQNVSAECEMLGLFSRHRRCAKRKSNKSGTGIFWVINLSNPTRVMSTICCMVSTNHWVKMGNFHKTVVTFTFPLTLCTCCIAACHYRHGTSALLEYNSGGSGVSLRVYACIYSWVNVRFISGAFGCSHVNMS